MDSEAAEKASPLPTKFVTPSGLPVISLTDTPGFMVGPDNEREAAPYAECPALFLAGAKLTVPVVAVFLRKGYGLGCHGDDWAAASPARFTPLAWPTGEFGGMGLEGAVRLGFKKELDEVADTVEREALFQQLLARMYELGKATEAAAFLEIDAVIDPADTRSVILRALAASVPGG